MLTILGPTATGKTKLAAALASEINGEVISADSRQVYRGMDKATGKDFEDYIVNGKTIPFHLVDIVDPGYEYNVFEFQRDFLKAYEDISNRGKSVVLCGGTGMYIEAVLKRYKLIHVPMNEKLRNELAEKETDELISILSNLTDVHNTTDLTDRNRLLRAIEIQKYYQENPEQREKMPEIHNTVFGIRFDRQVIRERITERLKNRLDEGMIAEVENLLHKGLTPAQLKFYGLEYKFLTQYVTGEISYDEMFTLLNTAIHQFAKRQTTWFRRMGRSGIEIHWIDGRIPLVEKVGLILSATKNLGS